MCNDLLFPCLASGPGKSIAGLLDFRAIELSYIFSWKEVVIYMNEDGLEILLRGKAKLTRRLRERN